MTDELLSKELSQKHKRPAGARKPFLNQKKKKNDQDKTKKVLSLTTPAEQEKDLKR